MKIGRKERAAMEAAKRRHEQRVAERKAKEKEKKNNPSPTLSTAFPALFLVHQQGLGDHTFTLKQQAKEKRDELIKQGQKDACVSKGPDHDKHFNNRGEIGWNKGRHPKKGHKGKKDVFLKK